MGTEGDSFFVVFSSVSDAVNAVLEAQRAVIAYPWPDDARVGIRMGLHTGEPTRHEDGYVGIDVHRAARIAACAHGGQVLLAEPTYRIAAVLPLSFVDLGWHRLKDIPEAEHLYQLAADDLPRQFPPPKSLGSRTKLPLPPTPIVGREVELETVRKLLTDTDIRLVSLVGPGGCGKTSLAVAAAPALEQAFPDGIYFVPLEEVTSVEVMWNAIAEAVGSDEGPARERLLERVAPDSALLVLDNLEQLTDACDVVADLLAAAPRLTILATSRAPLHLLEEYEHPVPPLTLPSGDSDEDSGAVLLFAQRARMVRPDFVLIPENRPIIDEICRRLDGLPLAIELAAARLKLIGPRALLARLDASLEFPGTRHGRPARQQNLRSTIAWSYGLLPADQQTVFARLGVFAGGADLAACAAVTEIHGDPLDVLADLADSSLVRLDEGADGEPRVYLLQTIASFARERLVETKDLEPARQRHAEHYLGVITGLAGQLRTTGYLAARDRIETELDNVRAALGWALGVGGEQRPSETGIEIGLDLCRQLGWFWYACGYQAEGREWLSRGIDAAAGRESSTLMATLHTLGILLIQHGEDARGRDALLTCLEFRRREGNLKRVSIELNSLARAYRGLGESDKARRSWEESIAVAHAAGDESLRANAMANLALLEIDAYRTDAAVELLHEALEIDQRLDDTWGVAHDHQDLALALLRGGRIADAYELLQEHAAASPALGDQDLTVNIIQTFCLIFAERADAPRAARLLGATNRLRAAAELPISAPDAATVEASIRKVRHLPDPETWSSNVREGSAYTLQEALTESLADH